MASKAKGKGRSRKVSAARLSIENKQLAREANKRLGTKFNTRKKALSDYAIRELKKYKAEGFITGDAQIPPKLTTVKANRSIVKDAKAHGFETRRGRIVVANKPERVAKFKRAIRSGNTVGVTKVGMIGFEHVVIPSAGMNFSDIIAKIDDGSLERMLDDDEAFGFKVYGNHSHALYSHMEKLREALQKYAGRQDVLRHTGHYDTAEALFENFELIRVDAENYRIPPYVRKRERQRRARIRKVQEGYRERKRESKYKSEADRKARARAAETEAKRIDRLQKQMIRQREARGGLKRGPR